MATKNSWPADKVERRPVGDLIPYARNARTHSDKQVDQIAASMREWGWTNPVLIDEDGTIIAGHGRILAAKKLGIGEAPVMVAEGWTEAQKKAYVIADNKLALNAGWDDEILGAEIEGLQELDFDLALLGFDDEELAGLSGAGTEGLTDPDELPEETEQPVSVTGDLWLLGNHRLLCGDSTSADDVGKLLGSVKPHLMVTDPPYGVNYDPDWRNRADRANGKPYGAGAVGTVQNDNRIDWSDAWSLFPGDVLYVWHAGQHANVVADSLIANDFKIRAQIIWVKNNIVISRGDYHPKHEPCWYAVRKNKNGHYCGGRKQSTVWEIDKPLKSETGHSTQKPVECMKRPIENNSSIGQAVYEPFSGSGTTIIAAEMTGRHCYAVEISDAYVDMAITRWQNFTGQDAVHEASGRTFNEMQVAKYGSSNKEADAA